MKNKVHKFSIKESDRIYARAKKVVPGGSQTFSKGVNQFVEGFAPKYLEKGNNRFWCVLGDGECAEGSVWEAVNFASYYKLDNITAVVDVNRLG